MKTIINPQANEISLRIILPLQLLETEGWNFDPYHQNTMDALGITFEAAQDKNYRKYSAYIDVFGSANNVKFLYGWYHHDRNEYTEREETGDDSATLKDILSLLDQGLISIDESKDYTVDSEEKYCHAFIQISE